MSPGCFGKLLLLLRVRLERDERKGYRSSGGVVEPAVRLGLTLRILAGATYLDMMLTFRVAKSTVFETFWDTVQAIDDLSRFLRSRSETPTSFEGYLLTSPTQEAP
jgi:hypothetical protein